MGERQGEGLNGKLGGAHNDQHQQYQLCIIAISTGLYLLRKANQELVSISIYDSSAELVDCMCHLVNRNIVGVEEHQIEKTGHCSYKRSAISPCPAALQRSIPGESLALLFDRARMASYLSQCRTLNPSYKPASQLTFLLDKLAEPISSGLQGCGQWRLSGLSRW